MINENTRPSTKIYFLDEQKMKTKKDCATTAFQEYPARDLNSQEQSSLGPEPSASTNSAIRAKNIIYFTKIRYVSQLFIFYFKQL